MTEEEVNLIEARKIVKEKGTKFVWLGDEPRIDMAEALEIEKDELIRINPQEIYNADKTLAESLVNDVLVCPHGNTSLFLAQHLKEEFNVQTFSLHGGITAIVGENNY
jgi:hypothetical protein